ncbi:uncharacterized protein MAM_04480 [Metarhizium album ARSEF 1941]|uniref:ER-bound oxygenase mpaB/mpaB'/Rubber oxygenase catalytic domain-containing protein n=1 Tax=Metarhizium album (strain ARSEF 1941) TaxID=1081103 RepID=A0A0B2WX66_METAS|nr:uncharacterized protein MAM_04480 [Metarhizium album ARSEF 1941]KHN97465.1 hypothetical protein MAM_04480 [Metarhizium album ARSEF 1941]
MSATSDAKPLTGAVRKRKTFSPLIHETIREPVLLRELLTDDIYLIGGQFAILCQFAHPGLAKGSYLHSDFASRIPQRLRNTARYLNAAVYGTPEEKRAIFSMIHGYHKHVKGDGYDADDPELHKWTAATLFVALIVVHETLLGGFTRQQMESLYKEAAVYGTSLRMPPSMWPPSLDDFWAYWKRNIDTLQITDMARKLSRDLLYPDNLPMRLRALTPLARVLTVHFLPERLAREYGLVPTTLTWLQYQAAVRTLRVAWPLLPLTVRQAMHTEYMDDLKRAVDRIERTGHWSYESRI